MQSNKDREVWFKLDIQRRKKRHQFDRSVSV